MHGEEIKYVQEAYDTNWMSTVGANINEVEKIAAEKAEVKYAVGLVIITSKNREEKFKSWICTDRRAVRRGHGCRCPIIREEKLRALIDEDEECIEKIVIWKDGRYEVEAA